MTSLQGTIKQQITSLQLQLLMLKLYLATVGVMNGSSIQTQVYRGAWLQVATAYSSPKFKVKVVTTYLRSRSCT